MVAYISVVAEGTSDLEVIRRITDDLAIEITGEYVQQGKAALDRQLQAYNNAARFSDWIVIRDLDHDAACAPDLVRSLLRHRAPRMRLRIAERAIESWLLADAEAFSDFFAVPISAIPASPDLLDFPKQYLIDVCRRSRSRAIRDDVVPALRASVGPAYTGRIIEYVMTTWNPSRAMRSSRSLKKCIATLLELLGIR